MCMPCVQAAVKAAPLRSTGAADVTLMEVEQGLREVQLAEERQAKQQKEIASLFHESAETYWMPPGM